MSAPPVTVEPVISYLIDIQSKKGWTDAEMAHEIQCSTVAWRMVKGGDRRAGRLVLDGALRRFPKLHIVYAYQLCGVSAADD